MRKITLPILILLLAPALAGAQTFVRWIPPPNVVSLYETDTQIVFTKPAVFPAGSSAQTTFGDGLVTAPAIAFAADLDTGFYRPGNNQIGVSQPLLLPDGTSGAPGLAFSGDTNTGIWRSGNDLLDFSVGNHRFQMSDTTTNGFQLGASIPLTWSNGSPPGTSDVRLYRDATNTLALRNGTSNQTFNVYGTYTDGSNYERFQFKHTGTRAVINSEGIGTGTSEAIAFSIGGTEQWILSSVYLMPNAGDSEDIGSPGGNEVKSIYLNRSIQGSKSKTLTESAATSTAKIAVPQTAGSNFADAVVHWVAYAADATDTQARRGSTYLAAVNKAGTETCTVQDIGTTAVAVSAGTLTCTTTCATGLTDEVEFQLNCVSSLTQTTLKGQSRVDMMQSNTYTPQ